MFTSFDEKKFRQAIIEKDFLRLKISAMSAISYDPTFERGEADEVLKILKSEVPEIFEAYKKEDYEEYQDRENWDKRYFSKLIYWFQENFSEERIPHIREVGKIVHRSPEMNSKKVEVLSKTKDNCVLNKGEKKSPLAGTLVVVAVLVLAVIIVAKLLTH